MNGSGAEVLFCTNHNQSNRVIPDGPSTLPLLPASGTEPHPRERLSAPETTPVLAGHPVRGAPRRRGIYPDTLSGPDIPRFLSELKAKAALNDIEERPGRAHHQRHRRTARRGDPRRPESEEEALEMS